MNTEQGNKLIARFEQPAFAIEIPDYHKSWNDLMPVVDKIEKLRFQFAEYNSAHSCNVRISQGYIEIEGTTGGRTFRNTSVEGGKINALWLAVIDFIKWYNEYQPKNIYNTSTQQ